MLYSEPATYTSDPGGQRDPFLLGVDSTVGWIWAVHFKNVRREMHQEAFTPGTGMSAALEPELYGSYLKWCAPHLQQCQKVRAKYLFDKKLKKKKREREKNDLRPVTDLAIMSLVSEHSMTMSLPKEQVQAAWGADSPPPPIHPPPRSQMRLHPVHPRLADWWRENFHSSSPQANSLTCSLLMSQNNP